MTLCNLVALYGVIVSDDQEGWDPEKHKYMQIADSIAARIESGEYSPGARLPSQRDLAVEYGVAPMTIRRAADVLIDRKLVVVVIGRGTVVANRDRPSGVA